MKTNVLKSAVLFAALSLAFTACQKDDLVTEMEKAKVEHILPNENINDRELPRDRFENLPMRENLKPENAAPGERNKESSLLIETAENKVLR